MISNSFDIHQFIEAVKGKNRKDAIDLAENEAVLAWHSTYRKGSAITREQKLGMAYHNQLLRLIDFIRSGVKYGDLSEKEYMLFNTINCRSGRGGFMNGNPFTAG